MKLLMTSEMKYRYLKRILIGVLGIWALIASIALLKMEPKVITIGIDQNGSRLIDRQDDPLLQSEVVNFIRHFTHLYYTYESQTFVDQVGNATGLMTFDLWKRKEPEIVNLNDRLKNESLQSISTLEKIIKKDDGTYVATLIVTIKTRMIQDSRKLEASMKLKAVPRSEKNPWGMELEALDEKVL